MGPLVRGLAVLTLCLLLPACPAEEEATPPEEDATPSDAADGPDDGDPRAEEDAPGEEDPPGEEGSPGVGEGAEPGVERMDVSRLEGVRTRLRGEASGHGDTVRAMAFSADGDRVLTTGLGGRTILWAVEDGGLRELHRLPRGEVVLDVVLGPDGSWALTGERGGTVRIWRFSSGEAPAGARLVGGDGPVSSLALSSDGTVLLEGRSSGSVVLRRLRVGSGGATSPTMAEVEVPPAGVHLDLTPDGARAVAAVGGTVRAWRIDREAWGLEPLGEAASLSGSARDVAVTPDGLRVLVATDARRVDLFGLSPGGLEAMGAVEGGQRVAVSADGRLVAWGDGTRTRIGVLDPDPEADPVVASLGAYDEGALTGAFHPAGDRLLLPAPERGNSGILHLVELELVGTSGEEVEPSPDRGASPGGP